MVDDGLQAHVEKIAVDVVAESLKDYTKKHMDDVVRAIAGIEQRLGYLGDSVTDVDSGLQSVTDNVGATRVALDELVRRADETGDIVAGLGRRADEMSDIVASLGKQADKTDDRVAGLSNRADETVKRVRHLSEATDSAVAKMDASGVSQTNAVTAISNDVSDVSTEVDALRAIGRKWGQLLLSVLVVVVGTIVWLLVKVVSLG